MMDDLVKMMVDNAARGAEQQRDLTAIKKNQELLLIKLDAANDKLNDIWAGLPRENPKLKKFVYAILLAALVSYGVVCYTFLKSGVKIIPAGFVKGK